MMLAGLMGINLRLQVPGVSHVGPFTKYQTNIFQVVPAFNLIAGVPLKFARVYAGIGPALFMSIYSFTMKGGGVPDSQVTAFGANGRGASAAAVEASEQGIRQAEATRAVHGDRFVQDLVNIFDANVLDGSVQPRAKDS